MAFVRLSWLGINFLGSGGMSITTSMLLKENVRDLELYISFYRWFCETNFEGLENFSSNSKSLLQVLLV